MTHCAPRRADMFGTCVCSNISLSFGESVWVAVGQGFVVTSVCCGYPTVCWCARASLPRAVASPQPSPLPRQPHSPTAVPPAQCHQLAAAIWWRKGRRRRRPLIAAPPSRRPCRDALLELLYPLYLMLRCAHPSPRVAHAVPRAWPQGARARPRPLAVYRFAYDVYPADHPHDGWYQRVDVLTSGS